MFEHFKNPDRRYAIFPIHHDGVCREHPVSQRFLDCGFAGVVGNIRYSKDFPDDEKNWKLIEKGFKDYINHGMKVWIYDENGYPSGSAGGAVTDADRSFIAEGLYCYEYWRTLTGPCHYRADSPADKLFKALLLPLDGGEAVDVTHFADEYGTLRMDIPQGSYHLFLISSRRLFDGTHAAESYSEPRDYINICDKNAVEKFIEITHENYKRVLGDEFGKGVLALFTDEPSLISWNIRGAVYPILPWHRDFPQDFTDKYGYPIELAVSAVVTRRGAEALKRRCDFWEFIADKTSENYFGTIQDWCRKNGTKSSGHMIEEETLQSHVFNYGSLYRCAKRMDWPGIDQLCSEPHVLMSTDRIPIARLLSSFADVYGDGESFTEFSDHTSRMDNRQIGVNWIRASVNWHAAMGINNFTSYYCFDNFTDEELKQLNIYTARVGYMIRHGRRESGVALLYPEASAWAAYTPSIAPRGMDQSAETQRLDRVFAKTAWSLIHRQIDFDYVDEQLINDGVIYNGKLKYLNREYSCVILAGAAVMSEKTVTKLTNMIEGGVGLIIIGHAPEISRDSGMAGAFEKIFEPYTKHELVRYIPDTEGWTIPSSRNIPMLPRIIKVIPGSLSSILSGAAGSANIVDSEVISDNILAHTRVLEDGGRVIFLTNMGVNRYSGMLYVSEGSSAQVFDPLSGESYEAKCTPDKENGGIFIDISLRPYDGMFYVVK